MTKEPKIVSKEPKIEKNIPVPAYQTNRAGTSVYYEIWLKLKPGDSLFYRPENGEEMGHLIQRIRARKDAFTRAHSQLNWKIVTRTVEGGIRVWRTE